MNLSALDARSRRSDLKGMHGGTQGDRVKQTFLWLGLGFCVIACATYLMFSGPDFFGLASWTKGLGAAGGIALAILFLVGGIVDLFMIAPPRNTRKPGD